MKTCVLVSCLTKINAVYVHLTSTLLRALQLDQQSCRLMGRGGRDGERDGSEVKERGERGWRESWRADVPDSVNVFDGVADLSAELFFIKLHLQKEKKVMKLL